ncbi:DNA-binding CsgD family transcriptional regulator [Bradyrhizobium sp. LB7.2]
MTEPQQCPLTARELEIARYLSNGETAASISGKINCTEASVAMQIKIARRVAGARNTPHLAAIALRKGWIE